MIIVLNILEKFLTGEHQVVVSPLRFLTSRGTLRKKRRRSEMKTILSLSETACMLLSKRIANWNSFLP